VAHCESWLHKPYTHIAGRLNLISRHYNPSIINVDQTNEKGFQDLMTEVGVPINPIPFTMNVKMDMMLNLAVLFEKGLLQVPKSHEILFNQCISQQYEENRYGKKMYFHPSDEHDDFLWSFALGAMALNIDVTGYNQVTGFGGSAVESMSANVIVAPPHNFGMTTKERDRAILNDMRKDRAKASSEAVEKESLMVHGGWHEGASRPGMSRRQFGGM
jgi:hypothetical protein